MAGAECRLVFIFRCFFTELIASTGSTADPMAVKPTKASKKTEHETASIVNGNRSAPTVVQSNKGKKSNKAATKPTSVIRKAKEPPKLSTSTASRKRGREKGSADLMFKPTSKPKQAELTAQRGGPRRSSSRRAALEGNATYQEFEADEHDGHISSQPVQLDTEKTDTVERLGITPPPPPPAEALLSSPSHSVNTPRLTLKLTASPPTKYRNANGSDTDHDQPPKRHKPNGVSDLEMVGQFSSRGSSHSG